MCVMMLEQNTGTHGTEIAAVVRNQLTAAVLIPAPVF
jgi:hypothetical protein